MHYFSFFTKIIAILLFLSLTLSTNYSLAEEDLGLRALVETVKKSLVLLSNDGGISINDKALTFARAKLEVSVVADLEAGGKVNFAVVTAGANVSRENAQIIAVTLTPPRPGSVVKESADEAAKVLSEMVFNAAKELGSAVKGAPPLSVEDITATVRFQVKKKGEAGLEFSFLGFGVELGGAAGRVDAHKIAVSFQ